MPKRSIRLSGFIAAQCQGMDARIFREQRHFFLNARLSAIKHSCAKTRAYMPATPIRVDVLDQAVRTRNSSIADAHALIWIENRPLHPPEPFENTRLASTSDASSDMISSAVRTRSRSATRRLAWRSRMRSRALRIERALENSGWVLRKPM